MSIDDEYELAWNNLGNAYLMEGLFGQARLAYSKVLELHPGYADALHGLGNVALQSEDYGLALEHYESVLEADPTYVTAHYGRAMAYRGLRDTTGAVDALREFRAAQVRGDP